MSTTLNASTSSGFVQTGDTSGTLELQSNGTTQLTVASTGTYGHLKSATAQASTSGTSIDFTSIPSWVKRITLMINGVSTSGSSLLLIQLGDSGGVETTGYLGAASVITSVVSTSAITTGFGINSAGASVVTVGSITLSNISGNSWVAAGVFANTEAGRTLTTSGGKTLSDTLDRVRLTTVNGTDTFDAGSINILYEG